jgi:dUTP pyrophosphatase
MKKIRGFELVSNEHRKFTDVNLPLRGSQYSAGYDFYSNEEYIIQPGEQKVFWTDVKSYMQKGEVLKIFVRSSIGIKKGLKLANQVGVIDSDYFENPQTDGNIGICLWNPTKEEVLIEKGERIAQGIFQTFLESDNCNSLEERKGGIGSTN